MPPHIRCRGRQQSACRAAFRLAASAHPPRPLLPTRQAPCSAAGPSPPCRPRCCRQTRPAPRPAPRPDQRPAGRHQRVAQQCQQHGAQCQPRPARGKGEGRGRRRCCRPRGSRCNARRWRSWRSWRRPAHPPERAPAVDAVLVLTSWFAKVFQVRFWHVLHHQVVWTTIACLGRGQPGVRGQPEVHKCEAGGARVGGKRRRRRAGELSLGARSSGLEWPGDPAGPCAPSSSPRACLLGPLPAPACLPPCIQARAGDTKPPGPSPQAPRRWTQTRRAAASRQNPPLAPHRGIGPSASGARARDQAQPWRTPRLT
jgi:hypothetical protein